jgi:hypothetical protein
VIYAKKDFYLLDRINEKIYNLKTSGLINYWEIQSTRRKTLKKTKHPKVLTLSRLIGSFYVLLFGWLMSFIVFVVEFVFSKVNHKCFFFCIESSQLM